VTGTAKVELNFTEQGDLSPREIHDLFIKCEEEGTAPIVFYEEGSPQTSQEFFDYMWERRWMVRVREGSQDLAVFWFSDFKGTTCFAHQWCFKAAHGRADKVIKACYEWCVNNTKFSGILGCTPRSYPLAIRVAKKAGAKVMCTIPKNIRFRDGRLDDAVITFYDLEERRNATHPH
jgi:hypothetical protein